MRHVLFLIFAAMPIDASAESAAARAEAAWRAWVAGQDAAPASFAVVEDGALALQAGIGTDPDAARPVASLSKALIAACAGRVVAEGLLTHAMTVGEALGRRAAFSDAIHPSAAGATLGELQLHASGIGPDATQGDAALAAATEDATRAVALRALTRPRGAPGSFAYNNENTAILAEMIAAAAGTGYEEACRTRVLEPLGIGGSVAGDWAAHGAWGGYAISAPDYARFLADAFPPPEDAPRMMVGGGVGTVQGLLARASPEGPFYWGFGLLCWAGRGNGAYAVRHPEGLALVATFTGCPDDAALAALDGALFTAVRGE